MKIEKFTEQQRELFEQFEGAEKKKPLRMFGKREERLSFSVSLDTLLLSGALLLTIAAVLYSVGVEIGREHQRMVPVLKQPATVEVKPSLPTPEPVSAPSAAPSIKPAPAPKPLKATQKPAVSPPAQPPPSLSGSYTIQILSFGQRRPAEKALETLRQRGYSGFLLTGPRATAVCVGNFARASDAQTQLRELQRLYPGSFVRKK